MPSPLFLRKNAGGFVSPAAAVSGIPTQSIDYELSSTQYLSMASASFGWSDPDTWSVVVSVKRETLALGQDIVGKAALITNRAFLLKVISTNKIICNAYDVANNIIGSFTTTDVLDSTSVWYAIQVQYSKSGASIKCIINGTEAAYDAQTNPNPAGASVHIGTADFTWGKVISSISEDYWDGLQFSGAFFDGSIPTAASVFDGTAGKLKDLTGLTGLRSLLNVAGGSVVSDYALATDWTNNGTATASATVP